MRRCTSLYAKNAVASFFPSNGSYLAGVQFIEPIHPLPCALWLVHLCRRSVRARREGNRQVRPYSQEATSSRPRTIFSLIGH